MMTSKQLDYLLFMQASKVLSCFYGTNYVSDADNTFA